METIINSMIIAKGSAAIMDAVWSASSPPPPLNSNTLAVPAIKKPQINLTVNDGFNVPLDVIVAKTYVAESADVTKKIKIRTMATVLVINPNGSSDSMRSEERRVGKERRE